MTDDHNQLSSRQIARLLKKFCLHNGDIVLVKQSQFDEKEILEALKRGVAHMNLESVLVITVQNFDDLKILNQQEMNAHGWYHISQINRLTDKIKK